MTERISAIFKSEEEAEAAVIELRRRELSDNQIAIVTRHSRDRHPLKEVETGLLAGAGLGAILAWPRSLFPVSARLSPPVRWRRCLPTSRVAPPPAL